MNLEGNFPPVTVFYQDPSWGFADWFPPDLDPKAIEDIVRIDQAIREATKAEGGACPCKGLVNLFFEDVVVPKFHWTLTKPAAGTPMFKNNKLSFRLKWTFNIEFKLLDKSIADIEMTTLDLSLNGPFDIKRLNEILMNTIEGNVVSIGKQLFDHPEAFAKIIGAMAIKNFGPEIAASLLCRQKGVKNQSQNAKDEVEKEAEKKSNEGNDKADEVDELLNDAEKAIEDASGLEGGGGGLLSDVFSLFGEIGAGLGALLGAIGGITAMIRHLPPDDPKRKKYEEKKNKLTETAEKLKRQKEKLHRNLEKALVLNDPPVFKISEQEAVAYDTLPEQMLIDWSGQVPKFLRQKEPKVVDNLQWMVEITNGDDTVLHQAVNQYENQCAKFDVSIMAEGTKLYAKIKIALVVQEDKEKVTYMGDWSEMAFLTYTSRLPAIDASCITPVINYFDEKSAPLPGPQLQVTLHPFQTTPQEQQKFIVALAKSDNVKNDTVATQTCTMASGDKASVAFDMGTYRKDLNNVTSPKIGIQRVSTAPSNDRANSTWTTAKQELKIDSSDQAVEPLEATKIGDVVTVEWKQETEKLPDFAQDWFISVLDSQRIPVSCNQTLTAAPLGRRAVELTSPPLQTRTNCDQIDVVITPYKVDNGTLVVSLPPAMTIDVMPQVAFKITNDSYFDLDTSSAVLFLVLEGRSEPVESIFGQVAVQPIPQSGFPNVTVDMKTAPDKRSYLQVKLPREESDTQMPQRLNLQPLVKEGTNVGVKPVLWSLPDMYTSLSQPNMSVHFDWCGVLIVTCDGGIEEDGRQYGVSIRAPTEREPKDGIPEDCGSNELELYTYLPLDTRSVKLSPQDFRGKYRDQQVDLAFVVITTGSGPRLQGRSRPFRFHVMKFLGTRLPIAITEGLRVRHLASMSKWSNGPARVYLSPEAEDGEGQIQRVDWTRPPGFVNLEYPTPPPPKGSMLATDSRAIDPIGRRVFYIDSDGGISRVLDKFPDTKVTEHEELPPTGLEAKGTAATGGGGMLSVIETIETGIQFFWAGPNGDIRMAISKHQVWESITSEGEMMIPNNDTPELAPSRLLTCGIPGPEDDETTLLVWISGSGRVKFISVPNNPPWAGKIQPQSIDTDCLEASLSSDLVITYTVYHGALQTWIFWVTKLGGIRGACRTHDGVTVPPGGEDFRAFDVMPRGSAHVATKMKLLPQHNRQEDRLVLIWFDADCVIRAASPMETKSPTGPWCCFDLLCVEAKCKMDFTVIGQQHSGYSDKDDFSFFDPQWIFFTWIDANARDGVVRIMMEPIMFDGTNISFPDMRELFAKLSPRLLLTGRIGHIHMV